MFVNNYHHTLDSKWRLMLPSKFLPSLAAGAVITKGAGAGKRLLIFTKTEFEERTKKILALPMMDREVQQLRRFWFASAVEVTPDAQGRINIDENLRQHIEIDAGDKLALVGSYDYIEVFSENEWAKQQAELSAMMENDGYAVFSKYGI
jgi:MraZ protein